MQGGESVNKILLFMFVLSCIISAFSLGAMSYTFISGALPFGITSPEVLNEAKKANEEEKKKEEIPPIEVLLKTLPLRDQQVVRIYQAYNIELEKFSEREKKLQASEENFAIKMANYKKIKKDVDKTLQELEDEYVNYDKALKDNLLVVAEMVQKVEHPEDKARLVLERSAKEMKMLLLSYDDPTTQAKLYNDLVKYVKDYTGEKLIEYQNKLNDMEKLLFKPQKKGDK